MSCDWYVKYTPLDGSKEEALTTARNLGAGGVQLVLREKIEDGTSLRLRISLPPLRRTIETTGTVVWTRELEGGAFEIGIRFEDLSEEDAGWLQQKIDEILGNANVKQYRKKRWKRWFYH
mgnify:CR=1 FL=1